MHHVKSDYLDCVVVTDFFPLNFPSLYCVYNQKKNFFLHEKVSLLIRAASIYRRLISAVTPFSYRCQWAHRRSKPLLALPHP